MAGVQVQQFGIEYVSSVSGGQPLYASANVFALGQSSVSGLLLVGTFVNVAGVASSNPNLQGVLAGSSNLYGVAQTTSTGTVTVQGSAVVYATSSITNISTANKHNSITLFLSGYASGVAGMNMVVCCQTHPISNGYVPLSLFGNTANVSGLVKNIPLFTVGTAQSSALNLFVQGALVGKTVNNMNLFTQGTTYYTNKYIPLFLQNTSSGVVQTAPLVIIGARVKPVGQVTTASMNLFLQTVSGVPPTVTTYWSDGLPYRMPDAGGLNTGGMQYWSDGIVYTALMPSPLPPTGTRMIRNIPLYIKGQTLATGIVPLSIPVTKGIKTVPTNLFVSGY